MGSTDQRVTPRKALGTLVSFNRSPAPNVQTPPASAKKQPASAKKKVATPRSTNKDKSSAVATTAAVAAPTAAAATPSRITRSSSKRPAPSPTWSGEAFGRRGVFSRIMGRAPQPASAFGIEGVREADKGHMPEEAEAYGESGVLQSERGHTPVAHRGEGRTAERSALEIATFLEEHSDAELLPGGQVRCTTTGHKIPIDLYWLKSHWFGKKYETARRMRAKYEPAYAVEPTADDEVAAERKAEHKAERKAERAAAKAEQKALRKAAKAAAKKAAHESQEPAGELWSMDDVEGIDGAIARQNEPPKQQQEEQQQQEEEVSLPPTAFAASSSPLYGLIAPPAPPPAGLPPLDVSTPCVDKDVELERRAERMRALMMSAVATAPAESLLAAAIATPVSQASPTGPVQDDWVRSAATLCATTDHEIVVDERAASPASSVETCSVAVVEDAPPAPAPPPASAEAPAAAPAIRTGCTALTEAQVKTMRVVDLKEALEARGMPTNGLKAVLTARLLECCKTSGAEPAAEGAAVANESKKAKTGVKAEPVEGEAPPSPPPRRRTQRATTATKKAPPPEEKVRAPSPPPRRSRRGA
jgi:hypothetical protein